MKKGENNMNENFPIDIKSAWQIDFNMSRRVCVCVCVVCPFYLVSYISRGLTFVISLNCLKEKFLLNMCLNFAVTMPVKAAAAATGMEFSALSSSQLESFRKFFPRAYVHQQYDNQVFYAILKSINLTDL